MSYLNTSMTKKAYTLPALALDAITLGGPAGVIAYRNQKGSKEKKLKNALLRGSTATAGGVAGNLLGHVLGTPAMLRGGVPGVIGALTRLGLPIGGAVAGYKAPDLFTD